MERMMEISWVRTASMPDSMPGKITSSISRCMNVVPTMEAMEENRIQTATITSWPP